MTVAAAPSVFDVSNVAEAYVNTVGKAFAGRSDPPLAFQLLLERGISAPLVKHSLTGTKPLRKCYRNSYQLVEDFPDLLYCEGWCYHPEVGIPLEHAWLMTREGEFVDPTWKHHPEAHYFGVVFKFDLLEVVCRKTQRYGVLGNLHLLHLNPPAALALLRNATYERAELPV